MSVSIERRVLGFLERSLQAKAGSLAGSAAFAALEGWDSMAVVDFLGTVSDELGVELTVDELQACVTVDDVVARVAALR